MPEICPFRGVRYEMAKVGTLSDVVAPPYDVIDPAFQDKLYEASPYNVIRLEFNRPEANDAPGNDRYSRASQFLKDWLKQGVLRQEDHPALYVYDQTYQVEGQTYTRRGYLARVRLEPFGKGRIFPHEQTLSGPKADRLALYHATGFNLSPIFGLYPDPSGEVQTAIESGIKDHTPLEAVDHLGVIHRLWTVLDQEVHTTIQGLMTDRSIFIADGHHRYETGLKYRDDREAAGQLSGPDDPANFCLMQLVGMSDPGLLILPTHRLVSGFDGLTSEELGELLAPEFDVAYQGKGPEAARSAWAEVELWGDQDMLAFGTVADDHWLVARLRSDQTMDRLVPDQSADWRSLGVSLLHKLVLEHLLKNRGTAQCRYVHLIDEVNADMAAKNCDLAALVPPAGMEHVAAIASNLEKMPPKSTYFYPKLLTGMVLNPLK